MARSRRKTPIVGITTAETEKPFKVAEHRRERRTIKAKLRHDDDLPDPKAFGDPWDGDKDGKQWLGDRHPKFMRK